jgi:hypothetical protein
MKKYYFLIIVALILGLVLTGCSLLSNISQVPATEQSGVTYLTKSSYTGLVGLWHFDGDALDSSGNNNNGAVEGGASYVDNPTMGQALSFDGVDDYVGCGNDTSLNITQAITIEAWVKPSGFPTNPNHSTIATKALAYYFQVADDGHLRVYQYGTDPAGYHSSNNPISLDVWQHVAYTYDGNNVKMFINGVLDTTITVTGTINTSIMHLGIGMNLNAIGNPYSGYYRQFQGEIDEVRIWNRALTDNELIRYGFIGLLAPYKEPPKAFKLGRSIPLKRQYTDLSGIVVDSSAADPTVEIKKASNVTTLVEGEPIEVQDPGSSGYQYDSETNTWQFNWQTKDFPTDTGIYNIRIISGQTLQVNGPFEIQLK